MVIPFPVISTLHAQRIELLEKSLNSYSASRKARFILNSTHLSLPTD
jgi:hypothetical protein